MSRTGTVSLIFVAFCLLIIGGASLAAVITFPQQKELPQVNPLIKSSYLVASPIDLYKASAAFPKLETEIKTDDARPVIVDNFLRKHRSPMIGMGKTLVFVADKYGIDWKLLPAIAFQESNLGKKIPTGSFNAWGWAVFSGENSGANFSSWEAAIETVAKGIKERYVSQGLTTPEAIMSRYTPNSDGSWAFAVRVAMDQMVR